MAGGGSAPRDPSKRAGEAGGSFSIKGREHDASGALAVEDRMKKANLGGGSVDSSIPKPKRESFAAGLAGEAAYQNAVRAWQRRALKPGDTKAAGQKKALGGM